jgi:hypothetical protein
MTTTSQNEAALGWPPARGGTANGQGAAFGWSVAEMSLLLLCVAALSFIIPASRSGAGRPGKG